MNRPPVSIDFLNYFFDKSNHILYFDPIKFLYGSFRILKKNKYIAFLNLKVCNAHQMCRLLGSTQALYIVFSQLIADSTL